MAKIVGIDLGTSSVKTILIDDNQKTLSTHTENIGLLNPQIGFYEQDPETWSKLILLEPDVFVGINQFNFNVILDLTSI